MNTNKFVLIIGAKSDIGKELAIIYAQNNYNLYLVGRNIEELELFKNEIKKKYDCEVILKNFDNTNFNMHQDFYNTLSPKPYGVIVSSGYMNTQIICEQHFNETLQTINTNYIGVVSILNIIANDMEQKKEGFIIGISSVAGDRGRQNNYIYGSSKAALTNYLSGLRNRLYKSNIQVLTVKPGFVNTKMTKQLKLPKLLTIQPKEAAQQIFEAQQAKKDTIYIKRIWFLIMLIIKLIPETLFKRTNI